LSSRVGSKAPSAPFSTEVVPERCSSRYEASVALLAVRAIMSRLVIAAVSSGPDGLGVLVGVAAISNRVVVRRAAPLW
jgi:hypothetical protein